MAPVDAAQSGGTVVKERWMKRKVATTDVNK